MLHNFYLWTDGGSSHTGQGAAGCVIRSSDKTLVMKSIAILGKASCSEAELVAGILGVSCIKALSDNTPLKIKWFCDNKPIVDVVTSHQINWNQNKWQIKENIPVKHQALWHGLASIVSGWDIDISHLKNPHSIREHNLCDKKCRWAIKNGNSFLSSNGQGIVKNKFHKNDLGWLVLDTTKLISKINIVNTTYLEDLVASITQNAQP